MQVRQNREQIYEVKNMLFQFGYGGYSSGAFQQAVYYLQSIGLLDLILPFILIFTIVYSVLMKVAIFRESGGTEAAPAPGDKKINGVLAFAIALMTIVPHIINLYPPQSDPVTIINSSLPQVVVIIVAVILVLVLAGLIGFQSGDAAQKKTPLKWLAKHAEWIAVALVALIFLSSFYEPFTALPFIGSWLGRITADSGLVALVVMVLIFGIVIKFIVGESFTQVEREKIRAQKLQKKLERIMED